MSATKLRGALFGCGMISEFHLRGWNRIPEVEIVALGNRTIERAEARRSQFAPQARVYVTARDEDRIRTVPLAPGLGDRRARPLSSAAVGGSLEAMLEQRADGGETLLARDRREACLDEVFFARLQHDARLLLEQDGEELEFVLGHAPVKG